MDNTVAMQLIKSTFTQSFDENRYRNFAINLLNTIDESKAFAPVYGQYIKDAFKNHIRQYKRIGTYTDPDGLKIDIMIVYLHRESALDHARTMQRNFMVDYLKNRDQKDAALVAYVGENKSDWRFSLVRMEYKTIQTETGKVKVKEEFTPARRYSFLVGENEPNHTAQVQLLPILADTQKNPMLDKLETAFNIESVTKEFFERYKELFLQLKDELDALATKDESIRAEFSRCEIDTAAFAKKLLGQIVFLFFLQKKGWMGVPLEKVWGTGSKNFLINMFEKKHGDYKNFFHDMLEPLFYNALAVERKDNIYNPLNCKIPFLNGGLFEPVGDYDWQNTPILIRNEVFKAIFDTFNLYNFTVREDEPLEREVAVDPEMLGKVFENLLEVKDRKSKGAFYTPREIVHYMCQESLINYLDTTLNHKQQKLVQEPPEQISLFNESKPKQKSLAIETYAPIVPRVEIEILIRHGDIAADFDAAKGNGTSSYEWKLGENIRAFAREIDQALADIKICDPAIGSGAFPVGMMSEIIKTRNALSTYLPVDSSRSLYNFKRHAIENCIYGVDIDSSAVDISRLRLWLSLIVDEDDFQKIKPLPNLDYKIVCGNSLQSVKLGYYKSDIKTLTHQFTNETDPDKKKYLKAEIEKLIRLLTKNSGHFDFHIYFSEVFEEKNGFDVVIANPPYVRSELLKDQKQSFQKEFSCFTGTSDLFVYFYERGVNILHLGGILTFISSNKYFRSAYGEKLRQFLGNQTIRQLIDFGDAPVFDAMAYPSIIILQKASPRDNRVSTLAWKSGLPIQQFAEIIRKNNSSILQVELKNDGWRLESPVVLRLLEKIRNAGQPLADYVDSKLYRGIITGLNEALIIDQSTYNNLIVQHPSSAELLKPILRGRDIKRWQIDYADLYLIKIESSENKKHPWSGMDDEAAERKFADLYPAIHAHLNQYREALIKRDDQGKYFWELRSCKYWDDFDKAQIVWGNLAKEPKFSFSLPGYILCAPATTIISCSSYLLGILNSKLSQYLVKQVAAERQGGFLEFKPMYISSIPIPEQSADEGISAIVQKILKEKNMDIASVKGLEHQLNHEVYKLYNLSNDEIEIIENLEYK